MRLYLDTCVWCRPFDEPDEKVSGEAGALMEIIKKFDDGEFEVISSNVLLVELSFISSEEKRSDRGTVEKSKQNFKNQRN